MTAKILQKSLEAHAGGSLVSVAEIIRWSGRSRNWLIKHILPELDCVTTGRDKYYYSGDVAEAFEKAKREDENGKKNDL